MKTFAEPSSAFHAPSSSRLEADTICHFAPLSSDSHRQSIWLSANSKKNHLYKEDNNWRII